MHQQPLSQRAEGRWRGILPALGVDARYLDGKHHPCPICGEGKDRFRFDDKGGRGTWICSHCGAGDGIELVKLKLACDFKSAAPRIEALIGSAEPAQPAAERGEAEKRAAMTALWRSGKAVELHNPAGAYLNRRCGLTEFPACLRFVEAMRYHGEGGWRHPGLIAKVTAPDGSPATVHRTYLTQDGRKADVDAPRRLMPGVVAKGSAVRLAEPRNGVLGIAEGIETAFAASRLFGVPCWSAINARMLMTWIAPTEVKEVIVFGDNDATLVGQAAAWTCAANHRAKGIAARVEIPPNAGEDWDDVARSRRPTLPDHDNGERG